MTAKVVVLGGYGNFGRRICSALAADGNIHIIVAGRSLAQAQALARQLGGHASALAVDWRDPGFATALRDSGAQLLIHTCGPFQQQEYTVAEACIEAGCHYLDLADARGYVCGITALDSRAQARGLLLVSGASSVPALAAAVVDRHLPAFAQLDSIRHAISSGAVPPGIATMRAVMGYVGQSFTRWQGGRWQAVHGWQDLHARRLPAPLGRRWLASCDVPDLELFPQRYPGV
ncbi:MAG TPA: saccharopine dehydrogenase NADP-binding domain-containing protein, partial [Solimonas sp.]|nr:saccharopine dehydrogenase NADP-binding domain-containing protein [Solimonas sp.]